MPHNSSSTSNRLAVNRPTRGADRNRSRSSQDDPPTEDVLLPSLDDGITLLDIAGRRGVSILQSLVVDHLLVHDGPAFWIDANGYTTTTTLARLAPSRRLLDRVHVARGFTAAQHFSAVCDLPAAVNRSIQTADSDTRTRGRLPSDGERRDGQSSDRDGDPKPQLPSLIVAPAVDAQYRADDSLGTAHAETLQARTLARLRRYADGYDVPVLLTRTDRAEFTAPIDAAADQYLECERTRLGPRFVGNDFETLVYPVGDGAYYQTTFAYWQQVLDARARQVGLKPATDSQSTKKPAGVGTGVRTDGESVAIAADPLGDAWTAAGTGGR